MIEAYPLQWPDNWKVTPNHQRRRGRYKATFARAREATLNSLRLMGIGRDAITISSNVPVRRDGLPYSTFSGARHVDHPGIAVYWFDKGELRVMACDQWNETAANLWAVHLSLEALRTLQRTGASQIFERAFSAFGALPGNSSAPKPPQPSHRPWREVFGIPEPVNIMATDEELLEMVEAVYKSRAKKLHPDRGGSAHAMTELNLAIEQARRELRP